MPSATGPARWTDGPVPANCESLGQKWYQIQESQASPIFGFMAILPFVTGVFLGGPLIAREIERGTTRLAWSIAPSRLRWYLSRMLPIVVAVVAITFAAGLATDRLTAAISPNVDIANSFDSFGQRGVLVAITALVIAAGAIGLGAVTGRVLPTVILALILGTLGITGVDEAPRRVHRTRSHPGRRRERQPRRSLPRSVLPPAGRPARRLE